MKNNKWLGAPVFVACFVVLLVLCEPAAAHPGHAADSFVAGMLHPLSGIDHLLAMFMVGMLASGLAIKRVWVLPTIFVGAMAGGGCLGVVWPGTGLWAMEWGICWSVVVFAGMVAFGGKVPIWGSGLAAVFAVCHGYAHMAEISGVSAWGYFPGMLAGTGALHAAGLGVGALLRIRFGDWSVRLAGATGGLGFLVTLMCGPQ